MPTTTSSINKREVDWGLGLALGGLLLASCAPPTPPPQCTVSGLLLKLSELPSGMEVDFVNSPAVDSTPNSETRVYSMSTLRFSQSVYWYSEIDFAERKYEEVYQWTTGPHWERPPFELTGFAADKLDVGCGPINDGVSCVVVVRYGSAVSMAIIQFPGGNVKSETVIDLVGAMDEKLTKCVSGE